MVGIFVSGLITATFGAAGYLASVIPTEKKATKAYFKKFPATPNDEEEKSKKEQPKVSAAQSKKKLDDEPKMYKFKKVKEV